MDRTVIIFAKLPAMGLAKTRLARDVGKTFAWRINRRLTERLLRGLADLRWRLVLAVAPDNAVGRILPRVWPSNVARIGQGHGGLGERLERVLQGACGPVVIIGVDAPDLIKRDIVDAFEALRSSQAVFGPAADGGFWLIGLRREIARRVRLDGVRWSSAHTLSDVRARLPVKTALLRTLIDLDDGTSYRAWIEARSSLEINRGASRRS